MHRKCRILVTAALSLAAVVVAADVALAKTPGHEYCFHGICHTVKTLEETRRLTGVVTKLKASFYDDAGSDSYNPSNQTSSGEYFHSGRADNAASPIYPDGTKLLVWHPASRKALMIRVNNAGPYWGDRKLDLSRAAAEKFGMTHSGTALLHVKVVQAPTKAEATYKRGRSYPPVKGYIGQFASLDAAATAIEAPTTRLAAKPDQPPTGSAATRVAAAEPARSAPQVSLPVPQVAAVVAAPAKRRAAMPLVHLPAAVASATPRVKPAGMTALDLKLASGVEREARKFLVAQR